MSEHTDVENAAGTASAPTAGSNTKCCKCGYPYDVDEDSAETISLIGLCEDCMTNSDWSLYYAKMDAENE